MITVINASAATTILEQRPEKVLGSNPAHDRHMSKQHLKHFRQSNFRIQPETIRFTYGRHSLRKLGPKLWRKLPMANRSAMTLKAFTNRMCVSDMTTLMDTDYKGCILCLTWVFVYRKSYEHECIMYDGPGGSQSSFNFSLSSFNFLQSSFKFPQSSFKFSQSSFNFCTVQF